MKPIVCGVLACVSSKAGPGGVLRPALVLVALACLFSTPARAEVVQAELTGQVYRFEGWNSVTQSQLPRTGGMGIHVGDEVQGLIRYDTKGLMGATGPYDGLHLTLNGIHLDPMYGTNVIYETLPGGYGGRFEIMNNLAVSPNPLGLFAARAAFAARDPQYQLAYRLGALPGSAALASYSLYPNAEILLRVGDRQGDSAVVNIAVDSIAVSQAPEPSSLVLFGLGGLGLLVARRRGRAAFTGCVVYPYARKGA